MDIKFNNNILDPRLTLTEKGKTVEVKMDVDTLDIIATGDNFAETTTLEALLHGNKVFRKIGKKYPTTFAENSLIMYHLVLSRLASLLKSSEMSGIAKLGTTYSEDSALLDWFNFLNDPPEGLEIRYADFASLLEFYDEDIRWRSVVTLREPTERRFIDGYTLTTSPVGLAIRQSGKTISVKIYNIYDEDVDLRKVDGNTLVHLYNSEFSSEVSEELKVETLNLFGYHTMVSEIKSNNPLLAIELFKLYTNLRDTERRKGIRQ